MQATIARTPPCGASPSSHDSSALTVPSSAFTGAPSGSVMLFGRAKYERYSSHGTSAINSGAGIAGQSIQ